MARFFYGGQELDLDWLVSYGRVSSPQQDAEHGGGGIARQREMFADFQVSCGVPTDEDIGSLVDEGISGSKGKHIDKGALGQFINILQGKVPGKRIKPKTGLVVESFSRLSRLNIDEALALFLAIVQGKVTLITLVDRRSYTLKSIRADQGAMHGVTAAMNAARQEAESKVFYSTRNFKARRGAHNNVIPSWIDRTVNGVVVTSVRKELLPEGAKVKLVLNAEKAAIVRRIFRMALTGGVDAIARQLNCEAVPVLNERKRLHRNALVWDKGSINKLLRSQSVIGKQSVGHYVDGKRVVKEGEYTDAYPAAISEELFWQVQAKIDSRSWKEKGQRQTVNEGRNATRMTNLFGDLCQCGQCGNRMKVFRRGDKGEYAYLGCSSAHVGGCDNKRFFRLDQMERTILPKIACDLVDDQPKADPADTLDQRIATARKELASIEARHEQSMGRTGALAERTQAKLEAEFDAKSAELRKLEAERNKLKAARPSSEAQNALRSVLEQALDSAGDEQVNARRIVGDALPSLVERLECGADGVTVTLKGAVVRRWHVALKKGDKTTHPLAGHGIQRPALRKRAA